MKKMTNRLSSTELLDIFGREEILKILIGKKRESKIIELEIQTSLENVYHKLTDSFSIWFMEKYYQVFKGDYLDNLNKEIKRLKMILYPIKGEITDDMIQRAKEFPIIELIKNRRGMALCFNHPDKRPSLSLKNNYAYCFGCGYSADSIKLYMDLNNVDFKTAVKALN